MRGTTVSVDAACFKPAVSECERDDEQNDTRENDAKEISIHRHQEDRFAFVPCFSRN